MNGRLLLVACLLPGRDPLVHLLHGGDASTQGLSSQDGEFDLGHIQPTTMKGSVMDLQLLRQSPGFCWFKGLIEGGGRVRVQIVHDQDDLVGLGIVHVDQLAHKVCPVDFGAPLPDLEKALARQRFEGDIDVTPAIGIILIVDSLGMAWLHGQGLPQFRDQLFSPFIQTDVWALCIVGARVDLQDLFHMVDEVGIGLWWNAPLPLQPRFEFVFFNTCRTVSWLTLSTISSSTSLRFSGRGGCGLRLSAASKPPCAKLWRARPTVDSPTSRASWICRLDQRGPCGPQSALSKMRARVILRAGACPALISASRSRRCSAVKTMLCFFMEVSLSNWKNLFVAKDTSFFSSCQMNFDGLVGAGLPRPSPIYRRVSPLPSSKQRQINRRWAR